MRRKAGEHALLRGRGNQAVAVGGCHLDVGLPLERKGPQIPILVPVANEEPLLRTVVCVTTAENYRLEKVERSGTTGPEKYVEAGVTFLDID